MTSFRAKALSNHLKKTRNSPPASTREAVTRDTATRVTRCT